LEIVFKRNKQAGKELKVEVQALYYNDVSAGAIPKTVLQYEWSVDKTGAVKELQGKATVGSLKINGHYDARKNMTKIDEKMRGMEDKSEKESKKTLPGLVVIGLTTSSGMVNVSY